MRRSHIITMLIALVIIGLVMTAYVIGIPPFGNIPAETENHENAGGGLAALPETTQSSQITFEEAVNQLQQYLRGNLGSPNFTLHYVRGKDVDYQVRATQWVFGVRYANQSVLMYFDNPGWRSAPWEGAAPEKEITMDSIITPRTIIRHNRVLLSGSDPVEKILIQRLELMNGKYSLTIGGQGNQQTFVFDSTSGALIS
jgi:hypothetical protein